MHDYEIINLCAAAAKIRKEQWSWYDTYNQYHHGQYDPISESAIAFSLIKEFELNIGWVTATTIQVQPSRDEYDPEIFTVTDETGNLNRAVALCVANMEKNKDKVKFNDAG